MKNTTVFFIVFTLATSVALSQSVSGGLRLGLNISNLSYSGGSSGSLSFDSKPGLLLGGYLTVQASDKLAIQPELLYSQMGASSSITILGKTYTSTASFNYLSVPLLAKYNITENFNLHAGPQVGFLLAANTSDGTNSSDVKDEVSGLDFGGVLGAGVDFGKFNAGVRYQIGFVNAISKPTGDEKETNTGIQLFVGYALFGK